MDEIDRTRVEAAELADRIVASGGTRRVADPDRSTRAAYRRAIHAVRRSGLVPDGLRLQISGCDRGDLVLRLVDDESPYTPAPVAVGSGDELSARESAVLPELAHLVAVSPTALPRAIRILVALADEARRRGHGADLGHDRAVLTITIGRDRFRFGLREEDEVVDVIVDEDVAAKRFAWQRVTPRRESRPSGRLVLRLPLDHGRSRSWGDRERWTLESRLPHALAFVESSARESEAGRQAKRADAQRQLDAWHVAMADARERFIVATNRERLATQVAAWQRARDLHAYADSLSALVDEGGDPAIARKIEDW